MAPAGHLKETIFLLSLGIIFCLLITSAESFKLHNLDRYPSLHRVVKKRGNMDLAFIQMYQLCDRDRNGRFSSRELQCVGDMLRLLIGVRS